MGMKKFFKFFGWALFASIITQLQSVTVENRTPYTINICFLKKTSDQIQQKESVQLKQATITKIYDRANATLYKKITSLNLLSTEKAEIVLDENAEADKIYVAFNEPLYDQQGWTLIEGECDYTSPDNKFIIYNAVSIKRTKEIRS